MKYMGSKARLSKHILPIILKNRIDENHLYVEPFVGGGNLIDKVTGNRWGNDFFKPTFEALSLIRDNLEKFPKNNLEFTEEDHKICRKDKTHPLHGLAGFAFSFAGGFYGGWCRGKDNFGKDRDYINEAYKNALKQSPLLQNVRLTNLSYDEMDIPKNSIVYCDPPYQNTTSYKTKVNFDHDKFWEWVRVLSKDNEVFVSEYSAPNDFETVFEMPLSNTFCKDAIHKKTAIEKLFIFYK